MTAITELSLAADPGAWRAIGLELDAGGRAVIGGVALRVVEAGPDGEVGITGWAVAGAPDESVAAVDGIPTAHADPPARSAPDDQPRLRPVGIDHVVVATGSLERTCGEIERLLGAPLKRVREAGGGVRQGFHRLGEVIVEVVDLGGAGDAGVVGEGAQLWGLVLNVEDLHDVAARCGPDVLSSPKPAVQPGRFIASFRAEAGLGTRLALMTPPAAR